jgi:GNAT superfamily N-acetyltransferase
MNTPVKMNIVIRPYLPSDREAIRRICCETGFQGNPVDPLFDDRDVFADFFTRYYTDWEPESAFVADVDGRVAGYLTCCLRYHYHAFAEKWIILSVVPKVIWRWATGQYNQQSKSFLKWCIFQGSRQTPAAPKRAAHFHFNLLPEYRNAGCGLRLFKAFMKYIEENQVKRVFGQIQTFDDWRTLKVFERFGFHELDRREITKFRAFHDKKVYVSTMMREL